MVNMKASKAKRIGHSEIFRPVTVHYSTNIKRPILKVANWTWTFLSTWLCFKYFTPGNNDKTNINTHMGQGSHDLVIK